MYYAWVYREMYKIMLFTLLQWFIEPPLAWFIAHKLSGAIVL